MEKRENVIAYNGRVIRYRSKNYVMRPEESLRGCAGCVFYNTLNCSTELTKYCLQGYVFKRTC